MSYTKHTKLFVFEPDNPETPPISFPHIGLEIYPPNLYWERVSVDIEVAQVVREDPITKDKRVVKNPRTGKPETLTQKIKVFQLDKKKNDLLKKGKIPPPDNFVELTVDDVNLLNNKFSDKQALEIAWKDSAGNIVRSSVGDLLKARIGHPDCTLKDASGDRNKVKKLVEVQGELALSIEQAKAELEELEKKKLMMLKSMET